MAKSKFPKTLYITIGDVVDGEPVFYATQYLQGIPDDMDGKPVAVFKLSYERMLYITRELAKE